MTEQASQEDLVSIGMPVYNGEQFVGQALDSLISQDYGNFELIICDNASTDRTPEICREYVARDKRLLYLSSDRNSGAAWNFNRCFGLARGQYFMWAAHDDFWHPEYLQCCLSAFDQSPNIVLSGAMCGSVDSDSGEMFFIDKGISTIDLDPTERFKKYKSTVDRKPHVGGIFYGVYKRKALAQVMPLRKVIATDHLVLADLCFQGEFATLPDRLMDKRWGGASTSHKNNARSLKIRNPFLIRAPMLVREFFLQKIILGSNQLTPVGKFKLSAWSLSSYLRYQGMPSIGRRIYRAMRSRANSKAERGGKSYEDAT